MCFRFDIDANDLIEAEGPAHRPFNEGFRVRLIFQTDEEGGQGGKPMAATGMADDADYFASIHVGVGMPTGETAYSVTDLICTTKMDATFEGVSAHAGGSPDSGKNALLAACNAAINLYAISRHGDIPHQTRCL